MGQDARAVAPCAGMENLGAAHRLQAADLAAVAIGAGVAARRQHHQDRGVRAPARRVAGQLAMRRGVQQLQQVAFQPQQQRLAFRIAETDVEFDQPWALRRQHQPGEEHAGEGGAACCHLIQAGPDDVGHHRVALRIGEGRRRGVGAHAAGVGAQVAVEGALVVLRRAEEQRGLAVAQREDADLLAHETFLDDDRSPGGAVHPCLHKIGNGGMRFGHAGGDDDALSGRQPIRLHDDGGALRADIVARRLRLGETGPGGGGCASRVGHLLGKGLAAFQRGGSLAGAETGDAGAANGIGQPQRQRRLGPHHHQVDAKPNCERHLAFDVLRGQIDTFGDLRDAGIAGRAPQARQQRRLGDLPAQRMLAPATADDQNLHPLSPCCARRTSPWG